MWQRTLDALGLPVGLACDERLAAWLGPRLATYAEGSAPPVVSYAVAGGAAWKVSRDGAELYASPDPLDAAAYLELDFYRVVVERKRGWLLHAAGVGIGGRAWVLAGPSGAGKSTLALGLVARGARYLSDEYVCVETPASVRGLARPIAFDPCEPPRAPPPGMELAESVVRSARGELLRSRLLLPPPGAIAREPLPLGGVVLLEHGGGGPYVAERLTPGEGLTRLWPSTLRHDAGVLALAPGALAQGAWLLRTRAVTEACAEIERLAALAIPAGGR